MKTEVYIDVIFLINLIMDLFILWTVSKIFSIYTTKIRVIGGGLFGALSYCIIIVFIPYNKVLAIILYILILPTMTIIAFRPKNIKKIIVISIFIFFDTIILGGIGFWILGVLNNGYGTLLTIILSIAITYLALWFGIDYFDTYISKREAFTNIIVSVDTYIIRLFALIDTGCSIYDPITGKGVIIAEKSLFNELLNNTSYENRLKFIPFTGLNNKNGVLSGIRSDYIIVNGKKLDSIIIGFSNNKLSKGSFNAIVSPSFIKED